MERRKKLTSILLSLVMALGLFPVVSAPARAAELYTDTLTVDDTGADRTAYVDWTAEKGGDHPAIASGAVYAGRTAKNYGGIQTRSKNKDTGIFTTASGGKVRRITVVWVDTYHNDNRYLAVYGSNTAYADVGDLFNTGTHGTLLATFNYNEAEYSAADDTYYQEIEITDDYSYIGFCSKTGALYIASLSVTWEIGNLSRAWDWADDFNTATCTFTDDTGSHTETADVAHEVTKEASYLADGVITHTASVTYDGVIYRDVQTETIPKPVFPGSVPYIDENGEPQDSPEGTVLLKGNDGELGSGWYAFAADTYVDDITFEGDVHLILCDGVTVTADGGFYVGEESSLTIYGQAESSGTLAGVETECNDILYGDGSLTVNGGTYRWVGSSGYGYVRMDDFKDLTVNGGSFTNCTLSGWNSVTINGGSIDNDEYTYICSDGGTVTINGGDIVLRANEEAVNCREFIYNGGRFKAENGQRGLVCADGERVFLKWTDEGDSICVGRYGYWQDEDPHHSTFADITVTLVKDFIDEDGVKYPAGDYDSEDLQYKTLRPDIDLWNDLQDQINSAENGAVIQLTGDCIASPDDAALVVPETTQLLTIDLNGYTIDRGLSGKDPIDGGNVITNHAIELRIIDTSKNKTGRITGGSNTGDGGGIISDVDTLELQDVTVSGNRSMGNGGGIWAKYCVVLNGSTVTDNVAGGNGGGVYWPNNSSNNKLMVRGCVTATGNAKADGTADNVFLIGSQVFIKVTGALSEDALIGVTSGAAAPPTFTSGLSGRGTAENFASDDAGLLITLTSGGEAKLEKPFVIHFDPGEGTGEMADMVTTETSISMPYCTFAAPQGKRFKAWSDGYGNSIEEDENVGISSAAYEYTITALWADLYSITVSEAEGGTLNANKQEAIQGEYVRLRAVPDAGCQLEKIEVTYGDQETVTVNNNAFYMPAGNVTVTATFTMNEYSVTVNASENGTVTADRTEGLHAGDTVELTIEPDEGFALDTLKVMQDETEIDVSEDGKFRMPAGDVTVTATFKADAPSAPAFGEHRMRLSDEICLEYYLTLPDDYDLDDAEVVFTVSDGRVNTVPVTGSGWVSCEINVLELADTIDADFFNGGDLIITETGYSATAYFAELRDEYGEDEELTGLIDSLEELGAQMFLSDYYDVNENGEEINKDMHTPIESKGIDWGELEAYLFDNEALLYSAPVLDSDSGAEFGIEKIRMSLTLNAAAKINLFIKPEPGVTITSGYVGTVRIENETYHMVQTKPYKIADLAAGLNMRDEDRELTVELSNGQTYTTELYPLSYIRMMLESDNGPENSNRNALLAFADLAVKAHKYSENHRT